MTPHDRCSTKDASGGAQSAVSPIPHIYGYTNEFVRYLNCENTPELFGACFLRFVSTIVKCANKSARERDFVCRKRWGCVGTYQRALVLSYVNLCKCNKYFVRVRARFFSAQAPKIIRRYTYAKATVYCTDFHSSTATSDTAQMYFLCCACHPCKKEPCLRACCATAQCCTALLSPPKAKAAPRTVPEQAPGRVVHALPLGCVEAHSTKSSSPPCPITTAHRPCRCTGPASVDSD